MFVREMLLLETKQPGCNILPHSDLRWGSVAGGSITYQVKEREFLLGKWKVRSLYREGSHMAAGRELDRYKLHLVSVQEVRWDKGGTVRAGHYTLFYGKVNEIHQLETVLLFTKGQHQRLKEQRFKRQDEIYSSEGSLV